MILKPIKYVLILSIGLVIVSVLLYFSSQRSTYLESEINKYQNIADINFESTSINYELIDNEYSNLDKNLESNEIEDIHTILTHKVSFVEPVKDIPLNFSKHRADVKIITSKKDSLFFIVGRLENHKEFSKANYQDKGYVFILKKIGSKTLYLDGYYNEDLANYLFDDIIHKKSSHAEGF